MAITGHRIFKAATLLPRTDWNGHWGCPLPYRGEAAAGSAFRGCEDSSSSPAPGTPGSLYHSSLETRRLEKCAWQGEAGDVALGTGTYKPVSPGPCPHAPVCQPLSSGRTSILNPAPELPFPPSRHRFLDWTGKCSAETPTQLTAGRGSHCLWTST